MLLRTAGRIVSILILTLLFCAVPRPAHGEITVAGHNRVKVISWYNKNK
jgi:hypothetical protein